MNIVLVTGKSGSGKSTFAKMLSKKMNCEYIDVDSIGHELYEDDKVIERLVDLFGKKIFDTDGKFDRKKLGEVIFANEGSPEVEEFNCFTWELMQKKIDEKITESVVIDWVLLPQTKYWHMNVCKVLVESTRNENRLNMIKQRDNISDEYLQARENAGIEYVKEDFDFVVENDYVIDLMRKKVDEVAERIENKITLKVLGCISPFCDRNDACPSYLITKGKTQILLDCGSGSHRFFNMKNLDGLNIFVSHLHRDHYNDLFNYQYASFSLNRLGRMQEKLKVFLPDFQGMVAKDIAREPNAFAEYFEIQENSVFEIGEFKIEFCEVEHSNKELKTYAIKLTYGDRKIVYSADVSYASKDKLASFAEDADLLVCEASLLKEHGFPTVCSHLTAEQAGEIGKIANVKKLLLTHFWAEEPKEKYLDEARKIFENSCVAKEEKEFYIF